MSKRLRYSDIVGPYFYNIGLTDDDKDMVDTHFTGAAHHIKRFKESSTKEAKFFHLSRHRIHLRLMMGIIFERGDFSKAKDISNRDLEHRETWNPMWTTMPDQNMFNKMLPDWRYPVGIPHCSDHYIHCDDMIVEDTQIDQRLVN
jgi:hypothetical protein